jgi:hypothetical protein
MYKEIYLNKLITALPNVSDTKLEKISEMIEGMVERLESNTKMSDERKDTQISQIISFKEILDEELESREILEEEGDREDILVD